MLSVFFSYNPLCLILCVCHVVYASLQARGFRRALSAIVPFLPVPSAQVGHHDVFYDSVTSGAFHIGISQEHKGHQTSVIKQAPAAGAFAADHFPAGACF